MKKIKFIAGLVLGLLTLPGTGRNAISSISTDSDLKVEKEDPENSAFKPWFELQFKKDSTYSYMIGLRFVEIDGVTKKVCSSRLIKKGKIIDELDHPDIQNLGFFELDTLYRYVPIVGVDELAIIHTSGAFCGSGLSKIIIGRTGNKLIKSKVINEEWEGEGIVSGSFISRDFGMDLIRKELVISTKRGYHHTDLKEGSETVYYTKEERFKLVGNEFKLKQVRKPDYRFVVAENGLSMRHEPFLNSPKKGVLTYGQKIRVIEVTDLDLSVKDGRNILNGSWVEIEFPDGKNERSFVFDGYLSKEKPMQLVVEKK